MGALGSRKMTTESSQTAVQDAHFVWSRCLCQNTCFVNEHAVSKSKSMTLTDFAGCHFADTPNKAEFGTTFARAPDGVPLDPFVLSPSRGVRWSSHYVAGAPSGTGWRGCRAHPDVHKEDGHGAPRSLCSFARRTERNGTLRCALTHPILHIRIGMLTPTHIGVLVGRTSFLYADICNNADTDTAQDSTRPQSNTSQLLWPPQPHPPSAKQPQALPATFGPAEHPPLGVVSSKIKNKNKSQEKKRQRN